LLSIKDEEVRERLVPIRHASVLAAEDPDVSAL
jgi:hypothetical protein